MKNFMNEFKQFILRGNVLDMAVGVIVGNSFKNISNSLVNDVLMPAIGMLIGNVEFSDLQIVLQEAVVVDGVETVAEVAIRYGMFIQQIVDFLIVAAAIFVMVKVFNKLSNLRKKEEAAVETAPAAPTTKQCPYCKSEIAIEATRCPHCTSQLY